MNDAPTTDSVWQRNLARVPELVADPDWPLGLTSTYKAIAQGQVPSITLAGTRYVLMHALNAQIRGAL